MTHPQTGRLISLGTFTTRVRAERELALWFEVLSLGEEKLILDTIERPPFVNRREARRIVRDLQAAGFVIVRSAD